MATHEIPLAAASASTVDALLAETEIPAFEAGESTVVAVRFVPATTQAAQGATNFGTLQVRDFTANTTTPVVLASLNMGTVALTAETGADFTLGTTVSVKQKDDIDINLHQTGTGGAAPAGRVIIETQ